MVASVWNGGTQVGVSYSFNLGTSISSGSVVALPLSTFGSLTAGVAYTFRIVTTNAKGTLSVYYPNNSLQNIVGPGIRVKSIRQHDNISTSNDIYTNYEYTESGSSLSSANFANLSPKYIEGYGNVIPSTCTPTDILKWNASSITPLADFNSNILIYNRVKEIKPTNGYSIYTFDVSVATPVSQSFPACTGDPVLTLICHSCPGPELQYRATRGKLLSQYDYNEGGTALRSIVNSYTETSFQSSSPMFRNVYLDCQSCLGAQTPVTKISMYRIPFIIHIGAKSLLNTKIETLDGISTTTTYEYDSQNRHSQPTASYFTNSNSEVNRTETKYTYDLASSTTKDALLSRNMLIPYETIKKVAGVQIDGNRTNYSLFSTHPRPSTVERFESNAAGTGAWVTKGTYNTYDASGNITQFTLANWPAENYTWQNGLIKTRNYQNFTWTYNYIGNNTRLLQSIVDIDAQTTSFTYDALMRLATSSARGGQVVTTNTYNYYTAAGTYNSLWSTTTYPSVANSYFTSKTDVQYLDGLGRLVETVKKHSAGNDVAHAIVYDNTGRVVKEHIPYPSGTNTGAYVAVPAGHPHKLTAYEASPLNRPSTVTPPSWLATTYTFGTNSGEVSGYTSGTLFRETMTDAQNNVTSTYKDKKGRLIMSRKLNGLDAKTYYTYDTKDRLTQVVPPDAIAANTGLIFTYTYDNADRMLSKKVPDAATVNMVYNSRDQLAYMQDGNLLAQAKYLARVYDVYGRDSLTGFSTSNGAPNAPTLSEVLTQNYYDGYNGTSQIKNLATNPEYRGKLFRSNTKILGSTSDFISRTFTYDVHGRATNVVGNNHLALANASAESTDMTYDFADNLLTENRTHTNGTTPQAFNQRRVYDELSRLHDYNVSVAGVENLAARYEYNYRNELIERNQHWSGAAWLQSIDYTYNDQGWLTTMNQASLGGTNIAFPTCTTSVVNPGVTTTGQADDTKDLFYMALQYNTLHAGLSGTVRNDGNISQAVWRVRGRERQAYSYTYDGLQRISTATYSDINDAGTVSATNRFNTSYTYADLRGNISNNQRNGLFLSGACYTQALLDNMTYTYTAGTNKISSISDAASATQGGFRAASGAITYDNNGNMISNAAKGITSISYNHLNLPINITITGGKTIDFTYDANGNKLRKVVKTGATFNLVQEYSNGIEYRGTTIPATTIEAIYHAEGRLYNNAGWKREYTIKDHLGNTRVAYCDLNNDGVVATPSEILQENNYDAFGYELSGVYMNHVNSDNLYQYNGKEKNDDHGLGLYDYGARWYDAGIGRWTSVDPMSSKRDWLSPYNYVQNNPILRNDPTGALDGPGDPVQPSVAGILVEGFNQARAGFFNLSRKIEEAIGLGTPGQETRMITKTGENGEVLGNEVITRPAAGFVQNLKETAVDLLALSPIKGGGTVLAAETGAKNVAVKTLKEQALEIRSTLNNGKNSVTIETVGGQTRYDLAARRSPTHGGVEVPHKQEFQKNIVNGEVKSISRVSKNAESMTQQDIRNVRRYLEKLQ